MPGVARKRGIDLLGFNLYLTAGLLLTVALYQFASTKGERELSGYSPQLKMCACGLMGLFWPIFLVAALAMYINKKLGS